MGLTQLEILYEYEPKRFEYTDRKFTINQKKLIIHTPYASGVTYLLLSHMLHYDKKERLYIDMNDFRIDKDMLDATLQDFIYDHNIKLLILDGFEFDISLPKCKEIIISTKNEPLFIDGFSVKRFYPLDFEEYIAFEKRYTYIEYVFNNFANTGTFPSVCVSDDISKPKSLSSIVNIYAKEQKELLILKEMVKYQSKKVSLYSIFKTVKEKTKISKDIFYQIVQRFTKTQLIIFLKKYDSPNSKKKLYLLDFAIKNILTFEKDFIRRFENIVFLELYKREKDICYTEECDFYIQDENLGILCVPFIPTNLLKNKVLKRKKAFKKLDIKKVQIISLGNEDTFLDNNIEYEVIPFWNWALSLDV